MINQLLSQQCSCNEALSFFFGFNQTEVNLYFYLVQHHDQTVAQLCEVFDRNQSTIYTALEKLVSHGLITKTKRTRETRGYEYIYSSVAPVQVKETLQSRLEKLYTQLSQCLENFDADALTCEIPL